MMLTEQGKNNVYFSDLLSSDYPQIWDEICEVFARYNYTPGVLNNTKDYWCRDFMPIQVGNSEFVQFCYDPDYLVKKENYKTDAYDTLKDFTDFTLNVSNCNLVVDGGNMVACTNCNGETLVVMTDKVFVENPKYTKDEIITTLESTLGAKIVWLPWAGAEEDPCGHTDGIVNFIDGTSEKPSIMAYYSLYQKEIADEMRKRLTEVFDVHELSFTKDEKNNWAYVNLLRTKDFIIVPGLGKDSDHEAKEQIAQLYPYYDGHIYQINIAPIIEEFDGAFNCLSWTIINNQN